MTNYNMASMKSVKVMIFTKDSNILTVVAAVPAERYGHASLRETSVGYRPTSCGTVLYPALLGTDNLLLRTPTAMSLTDYEKYLTAIGYQFRFAVKEGRGKSIQEALAYARVFIRGRFMR